MQPGSNNRRDVILTVKCFKVRFELSFCVLLVHLIKGIQSVLN